MEEAVEICKLRLFLKLVAQLEDKDQIEPLPDIDFNIRAGNTLVGFTALDAVRQAMTVMPDGQSRQVFPEEQEILNRIEEAAEGVSRAATQFRWQQTMFDENDLIKPEHKSALQARLSTLTDELDMYLAKDYGIDVEHYDVLVSWRASHQPFHWFAEFHGIMSQGGFDVVIGNPPYVEYSKLKGDYTVRGYKTESCGNLYAFVMERCKSLAQKNASLSMIVPLSGHSTERMQELVRHFYSSYGSLHLQTYSSDANPSRLFEGVKFRLAIFVVSNLAVETFTTRYLRWYAEERPYLFDLLRYAAIGAFRYPTAIPKVANSVHLRVLEKLAGHGHEVQVQTKRTGPHVLYHSAPVNWVRAHSAAPYFHSPRDNKTSSGELRPLQADGDWKGSAQAVLCSTTFFVWWLSVSDCYHLNRPESLVSR